MADALSYDPMLKLKVTLTVSMGPMGSFRIPMLNVREDDDDNDAGGPLSL